MKKILIKIFMLAIALIAPVSVHAGFEIREIMYDLEGADTGHEWIEVKNIGQASEDFTAWRLVEAETAHTLTSVQGGANVGASAVAVIADNATQFLADHPGFSGILFDSSFSLLNTGETLSLKDPDGNITDTVTYINGSATGDGSSLLRSGSSFVAHSPTPGVADDTASPSQQNSSSPSTPAPSNVSSISDTTNSAFVSKKYQINIGRDRVASVGLPLLFEATIDDLATYPEIKWSFGDGGSGVGESLTHMYRFAGSYVVSARATIGLVTTVSRVRVSVREVGVTIDNFVSGSHGYVAISNRDAQEINLTGMKLLAGGYLFEFPTDTIIPANEQVSFPNALTGIFMSTSDATISIVSAEGKVISEFKKVVPVAEVLGTSTSVVSTTVVSKNTPKLVLQKTAVNPQKVVSSSPVNVPTETIIIGKKETHGFWYKVITIPERILVGIFGLGS